jgi:hypothetical protein
VAAESLRDELLALPGVADAEVDESGDSPSGVRVKLAADADARRVGVEVQRILASHGLRSRVSDDEAPEPPEEPPPAPIIGLPSLVSEAAPSFFDDEAAPTPPPPSTPPPLPEGTEEGESLATAGELASVRLEETRDGIIVTAVGSDGRTLTERGVATAESMIGAVVVAVGTLADGRPPKLLAVERTRADGSEVVTVVVERADGWRGAGAAMVRASWAYAVGRATWSALHQ